MSQLIVPNIPPVPNSGDIQQLTAYVQELADIVGRSLKETEWFANGNISSQNVRNIAGFNVNEYELRHRSGIVGMSGLNPADPNAIRFWSGHSDPLQGSYRVTQAGLLTAIGALIRSKSSEFPALELNGLEGLLTAYQNAENFITIDPDLTGNPAIRYKTPLIEGFMGSALDVFWIHALTGNMQLSSNGKLKIFAGVGEKVEFDSWSDIYGHDDTETLAEALSGVSTTGGGSTIVKDDLTPNRAVISNSSGKITASTVTTTEIGYLSGVDGPIQTQLDLLAVRTGVSARSSASQTIASSTWTKVIFGSEENDTLSEFNPTTSVLTALRNGTYLFTVHANWASLPANARTLVRLLINGSIEVWIDDRLSGGVVSQSGVGGATQVNIASGATVEIQVFTTADATLQATFTRFSVCRVA